MLYGCCCADLVGVDEEVGKDGEIITLSVGERCDAGVEGGKCVVDEGLDLGGTDGVAWGEIGMRSVAVGGVEAAGDEVVVGVENGR